MSILVKDPKDGFFKLYCKGADCVIKERLSDHPHNTHLIDETDDFIRKASLKGLRSLLFSIKILDKDEVTVFLKKCKEAEQDIENRNILLDTIYDELESNLLLLGATVVEDKL
jgi:phospholipid-translocating ATPase